MVTHILHVSNHVCWYVHDCSVYESDILMINRLKASAEVAYLAMYI